jgi:hypothetical protein
MNQMDNQSGALKLPVWLKAFSNNTPASPTTEPDHEILHSIALALTENKSVVILRNGEPVEITRGKGSTLIVKPLKNATYVLK